jgi:demethylmenaquinone methyltransferase/2-methoxy-6-polyprenyl-1,4-benzoquinol methylase
MFAAIAPSYDLNNRLHSLWMDQSWRKRAVSLAELNPTDHVVDVACGTGDLSLQFVSNLANIAAWCNVDYLPTQVVGIDFTLKCSRSHGRSLCHLRKRIVTAVYLNGDAQLLPLADQSADVVSIAFGIRNVQDVPTALQRIPPRPASEWTRDHPRILVADESHPASLYNFYFRQILRARRR